MSEWVNNWMSTNTNKWIEWKWEERKNVERKKEKKREKEKTTQITCGSLAHKLSIGGLVASSTTLVGCRIRRACWMTVVQRHWGFRSRCRTWWGSAAVQVPAGCIKWCKAIGLRGSRLHWPVGAARWTCSKLVRAAAARPESQKWLKGAPGGSNT
jgi:hypothetical protein